MAKSTSKISQSAQRFIGDWSATFSIARAGRFAAGERQAIRRLGRIGSAHEPLRRLKIYRAIPCRCALPHVADAAFESFGAVSEGADATIPKAVVRRWFGLSFWPEEIDQK